MADGHRRTRPGRWLLGGLTAGLGMLAGSSAAGAVALDVTTTTIPVPAVEVPAATVPTTIPGVPEVPLVNSGSSDVSGIVGSTIDLPGLDAAGGGSGPGGTSGAVTAGGGTGGPAAGERSGRTGSGDDTSAGTSADPGGAVSRTGASTGSSRAGSDPESPRDLRTLRRLAVQSAGDFSMSFLLGALALAYLFFQRRMSIDDPTLVAAAAEDDELMRFS